MTEIPADIMKAAREAIDGLKCFPPSDKEPIQISVARAILAERERCAEKAKFWMDKQAEELKRLEHAVDFATRWSWKEDPPNASRKLSDSERLSAIKYHPTIKAMWERGE